MSDKNGKFQKPCSNRTWGYTVDPDPPLTEWADKGIHHAHQPGFSGRVCRHPITCQCIERGSQCDRSVSCIWLEEPGQGSL